MLERTFVSTVEALANALEANDAYTSSHARWITDMALLVGREFSLDRAAMKRLEFGALFHDIGKIGIPSEILRQARPADGRRVRDRQGAPRAGRADSGADRAPGRRAADRPRLPRAVGRARLPGRQGRRRDPDRGADRARLRRVPLDGHGPSVPHPPARRGGRAASPDVRRDAVRSRPSWRPSSASTRPGPSQRPDRRSYARRRTRRRPSERRRGPRVPRRARPA